MKRSIKRRVAFTFIGLMACTLLAIGIFHWAFMEKFYLSQKMDVLTDSWNSVNSLADPIQDTGQEFDQFCDSNNLTYAVANLSSYPLQLKTNSADNYSLASRLTGKVMGRESDDTDVLRRGKNGNYVISQNHDQFQKKDFLELWGQLDNGEFYIVRCPLESIADSAAISNQFYIYIGLAATLVSVGVIWIITRKIVKPVQELTALSERMANLDFNAVYTSGGEDEIGELGRNFNTMSQKLEKAVSELKSANLKLQKDIEERVQIDEMRTEFLSNVSHELKTPIALIQGYAEGLRDNISDDEESREFYCDVIIDESSKMNRMVRQLLTLNQLEFGNEQLSLQRFDLAELIRGVIQSSHILIEQKKAKILFEQPDPVPVWGDEFKIEEVVTNYLTNALNHLEGDRVIEITCREWNGTVTTTVFNTGKPIPEEDLDKIWIKFYKVDKARTREYGGSGIGLSIVKAIMDSHQQKCWARNYDNGVAFSFTLESRWAESASQNL